MAERKKLGKVEMNNLDRILEAEELAKGLLDTMYAIQTSRQDELIPITILAPFEAVLQRIYSLLKEMKEDTKTSI